MRQQFLSRVVGGPVGNLEAISLSAGETRGVIVDNPSGSWVQLFPTFDWIAPYTLGYTRTLPNSAANVSIRYQTTGPSGQVSTLAGDPIRVWLDTGDVGNAPGIASGAPFVEQFTPVEYNSDANVATVSGTGSTNIIPASAGRRIRLWQIDVRSQPDTSQVGDSPVSWEIGPATGNVAMRLITSSDNLSVTRTFPGGLDFEIGESLDYQAAGHWADVGIDITVAWSYI